MSDCSVLRNVSAACGKVSKSADPRVRDLVSAGSERMQPSPSRDPPCGQPQKCFFLTPIGCVVAGVLGGHLIATAALSAEPVDHFPSRPIHIVLPFTPGGGTDILARKLAPGMQQRLGQSVVIENKPG